MVMCTHTDPSKKCGSSEFKCGFISVGSWWRYMCSPECHSSLIWVMSSALRPYWRREDTRWYKLKPDQQNERQNVQFKSQSGAEQGAPLKARMSRSFIICEAVASCLHFPDGLQLHPNQEPATHSSPDRSPVAVTHTFYLPNRRKETFLCFAAEIVSLHYCSLGDMYFWFRMRNLMLYGLYGI